MGFEDYKQIGLINLVLYIMTASGIAAAILISGTSVENFAVAAVLTCWPPLKT